MRLLSNMKYPYIKNVYIVDHLWEITTNMVITKLEVYEAHQKEFWATLKEHGVPFRDLGDFSNECIALRAYASDYDRFFQQVFRKIEHLMRYAVHEDGGNDEGVLQMGFINELGEKGRVSIADGILFKGRAYVKKFITASDLECAVMLKNDDIPQIVYKD